MTENNSVKVRNGADVRAQKQDPVVEGRTMAPLADIYETPEAYVVMLDMPGAGRDSMKVWLERGTLTVKGPVEALHGKDATVLHREHAAARYERAFSLGEDVDPESIDAQFENGVLTIKLLKSEEVKPRDITIR